MPDYSNMSPYAVLGVSETDSFDHITQVYNNLVKLLHPDKANNSYVTSRDEQVKAFGAVRDAYKRIREINRITNKKLNKFDTEYSISGDVRINSAFNEEETRNININKFNAMFESSARKLDKSEAADPYKRGYSEFTGPRAPLEGPLVMPSYSATVEISDEEKKRLQKAREKRSKKELVERLPEEYEFGSGGAFSNCQELGVLNVSDFSMRTSGKGSICGTDLMCAFKDTLVWEDIVSKNPELTKDYMSKERPEAIAERMASARQAPIRYDAEVSRLIDVMSAMNQTKEALRKSTLDIRDAYAANMNMARLNRS